MDEYLDYKTSIIALRRVEGQVRGIQRMIESHKETVDILTQISAAKGALNKVKVKMLNTYFQSHITEALKNTSGERKQQAIEEILKTISHSRKE